MKIIYMLGEDLNKTSGGIIHFKAVARGLHKLGHSVKILGPKYHRRIRKTENIKGYYIPLPGRNVFSFFLFQFLAVLAFPFIYFLFRPDAILVRGGMGIGFLFNIMARLFGVKLVLEVNGITWSELVARGYPKWQARICKWLASLECRTANHIITVTSTIGEEIVLVFGISPENITTIHNGADPDEFNHDNRENIRAKMWIDPDKLVVGFVGRFAPWHGSKEIIESASYLSSNVRSGIIYLMVGYGEALQEAKNTTAEKGLEDIVRFTGQASRAEVADYLSAFDVGILIQSPHGRSSEGKTKISSSALKFWEYLAAGLPVIISDDISLTPIVRGENMGIALDEYSPKNIAMGIEEIFNRRQEFAEVGKRNRKLVYEKYSWLEVSKKVSKVLAG